MLGLMSIAMFWLVILGPALLLVAYLAWPPLRIADRVQNELERNRVASHDCTVRMIALRDRHHRDGLHGIFSGWDDENTKPETLMERRAAHDARIEELQRELERLPDASFAAFLGRAFGKQKQR